MVRVSDTYAQPVSRILFTQESLLFSHFVSQLCLGGSAVLIYEWRVPHVSAIMGYCVE